MRFPVLGSQGRASITIIRLIVMGFAVAALLVVVLGVAVRLYMDRPAENRVAPAERVAIQALRSPLPTNAFLACPPGYCAVAGAMPSPVFAMPWQQLERAWTKVVAGAPRVTLALSQPSERRFVYIQHSALLRFPDIVTVEFVALGSERSSLAVYSRARYGRSDFGVNRQRVMRWLARLEEEAQRRGGACGTASPAPAQGSRNGRNGRPAAGTEPRCSP